MDTQTLAKLLADKAPDGNFNCKYWTDAAWNHDATTLLDMIDYFSAFNSKHWFCYRKVALQRGLVK